MKIAVCGKGGVGKTTFAALLAMEMASRGEKVYAIDADVNPSLGEALGLSFEEAQGITPISEMAELIEERTGAKVGEYGSYFKSNPRVKDIPEKFSRSIGNVHFLMMGGMKGAEAGCACAENAMLRALVTHLVLKEKETVILDMVAGTEHMGRGTAKGVDVAFLVVEPGMRSIKTAKAMARMSKDLGIRQIYIVANKISSQEDEIYIKDQMAGFDFVGFFPKSDEAIAADKGGKTLYEISATMRNFISQVVDKIVAA